MKCAAAVQVRSAHRHLTHAPAAATAHHLHLLVRETTQYATHEICVLGIDYFVYKTVCIVEDVVK